MPARVSEKGSLPPDWVPNGNRLAIIEMTFPRLIWGVVCVATWLVTLSRVDAGLVLADAGKTGYRIVVSMEASPSEVYAASELQRFLKEISNIRIPIVSDQDPFSGKEILVGNSSHFVNLAFQTDWAGLGDEGYYVKTSGDCLILAGGKKRGTLYAVYGFLEEILGCRWYAPDVSHIPRVERIEISELDLRKIPIVEFRAVGWASAGDPDWAARNRVNNGSPLENKHGGQLTIYGGGHNFQSLVPPSQYFEIHPEYYAEINGRRTYQKAQLCLTNREVIELVAGKVKDILRANPDARLVGVGQDDWGGWCECPNCRAIDEAQQSHSGTLIHFLNQVGELIEPEFPHVSIVSLAYQHTRTPPKDLKPRKNVIPWVCGIECCYSHPIETCEINRSFKADVEGWARLSDKFYIFDYTANFEHYIMPHPNLRVLQPNYQMFVKNHVRGIFASGNTGKGSEMGELRGYLLARLLWDPDGDVKRITTEFLEAYYGNSAGPIARYIDLMHDKVEKEQIHCLIATGPRHTHLTPEMITKARTIFDEAERAADNETIRERVRLARMPIQHVELEWAKPSYQVKDGFFQADLINGVEELAREFAEVGERNCVPRICEFENRSPSWHLEQQAFWKKKWPAVRLENKNLRVDIVPGLGGRIVSLFHKGKARELLLPAQPDGREYPWSGGYEEYSQRGGRTDGWHEEYGFQIEEPGRLVSINAKLPNGLKNERTLSLSPDEDVLMIQSRLSNVSSENKMASLRIHPIFTLGPTEQVVVSFETIAGVSRSVRLTTGPGVARDMILLQGDDRPRGKWTARNENLGLAVCQIYEPTEAEQVLLDWLPSRERFFFELVAPEKYMSHGDIMQMTTRYEVIAMP